jgi:hypothetical protein
MRQFLVQLGETGVELAGERDGAGLFPWVVAGGAAVAACEIARRQLGRHAGAGDRTPGSPPDPFFAG